MSDITKELTAPVELMDAELDAVAAGEVRFVPDNASPSPVVYGPGEEYPAGVSRKPKLSVGQAVLVTPNELP